MVESEMICKLMIDHFQWNELEWNTNLSNTLKLSDYSYEVSYLVVLFWSKIAC